MELKVHWTLDGKKNLLNFICLLGRNAKLRTQIENLLNIKF